MLSCSALRAHELLRGHHGGKRTLQQFVGLHQGGFFFRVCETLTAGPQSAGRAEYEGVRFPEASVHALTTPVL